MIVLFREESSATTNIHPSPDFFHRLKTRESSTRTGYLIDKIRGNPPAPVSVSLSPVCSLFCVRSPQNGICVYSSEAFSIFACLKDYIFIVPILKSYPLPNASRRNRISRLIVHGGLDTFIFLDLFAVLGEEVENGLGWGYLWARGRLDLGYYGLTDHDESLAYRCLSAPVYGVCDSEYKFDFHEIILLDQSDLWTNFRISLGITNAHSTAGIWYQNVCVPHMEGTHSPS